MSPYSLSVNIDDIIETIAKKSIGCVFRSYIVSIIYADDILLLVPSIDSLQGLLILSMCEHELGSVDLAIYVKKSVCTRIGPWCYVPCCDFTTIGGASLQWVDTVRYLGVYIYCSRTFQVLP